MPRQGDGIDGNGEPFVYGIPGTSYDKINHITGISGSVGVFLVYGQSNCANFVNGTYALVNGTKVFMLNPFTGGVYLSREPMMGCNGGLGYGTGTNTGNWTHQFADKLVTAGKYANVVIINVAAGGTTSDQWANADGIGNIHRRLLCGCARALQFNHPLTGVIRHLGESDATSGYTSTRVTTNIQAERTAITAMGISTSIPLIVNTVAYYPGGTTSVDTVQTGQANAVNGTSIKAGVNADSTVGENSTNRYDGLHYNTTGASLMATAMKDWVVANL